jgi:hypothetical protein
MSTREVHYGSVAQRRIAARRHRCECGKGIAPGDVYVEHKSFPGHDSGYATSAGRPVRAKECAECAARYGREHLLEPVPEHQQTAVMLAGDSGYLARSGASK